MSEGVLVPPATTIVNISGKLPDGSIIEQEFPVTHPIGSEGSQIILGAFQAFKQLGGFVKDIPGGGMEFYMASKFDAPFSFTIKNVVLVSQSALPAGKPFLV